MKKIPFINGLEIFIFAGIYPFFLLLHWNGFLDITYHNLIEKLSSQTQLLPAILSSIAIWTLLIVVYILIKKIYFYVKHLSLHILGITSVMVLILLAMIFVVYYVIAKGVVFRDSIVDNDIILENTKPSLPNGCASYFDGCNTCVESEHGVSCTEISCKLLDRPHCLLRSKEAQLLAEQYNTTIHEIALRDGFFGFSTDRYQVSPVSDEEASPLQQSYEICLKNQCSDILTYQGDIRDYLRFLFESLRLSDIDIESFMTSIISKSTDFVTPYMTWKQSEIVDGSYLFFAVSKDGQKTIIVPYQSDQKNQYQFNQSEIEELIHFIFLL